MNRSSPAVLTLEWSTLFSIGGGFVSGLRARLSRFVGRFCLARSFLGVIVSKGHRHRVGPRHNKSLELTRDGLAALRGSLRWRAAQFQR